MSCRVLLTALTACAWTLAAAQAPPRNPVLGVASAPKPFSIGSVETKPEAGPVVVVEGDQISASATAVTFRLNGENRAVLSGNSTVQIRGYQDGGIYFYLGKGSIQFDVRRLPLAICARDRLYLPSVPASGEVVIAADGVQVKLTAGSMVRSGTEGCEPRGVPVSLSGSGTATGGGTTAAGTATATATATAAGVGTATVATVTGIAVAAATAAGVATTIAVSQPPSSESPITPGQ